MLSVTFAADKGQVRFREATGGHWLDCPLSGGAPGALTGRLTVVADGTGSA